jgi:hypothetical protein
VVSYVWSITRRAELEGFGPVDVIGNYAPSKLLVNTFPLILFQGMGAAPIPTRWPTFGSNGGMTAEAVIGQKMALLLAANDVIKFDGPTNTTPYAHFLSIRFEAVARGAIRRG